MPSFQPVCITLSNFFCFRSRSALPHSYHEASNYYPTRLCAYEVSHFDDQSLSPLTSQGRHDPLDRLGIALGQILGTNDYTGEDLLRVRRIALFILALF